MFDNYNLLWLLSPPIVFGVIIFLFKLFTRIITSFNPLSYYEQSTDETIGIIFSMTHIFVPGILGYVIYNLVKYLKVAELDNISLIILLLIILLYGIKIKDLNKKSYYELNKSTMLDSFISSIVWASVISSFFSEHLILFLNNSVYALLIMLMMAIIIGKKTYKPISANLILNNNKNIENCKIIKVHEDAVLIEKDDTKIIINKSNLLKIEILNE